MAPFAVASVVLLFIARRLRAGDLGALGVARQWAIAALGVVALSVLVQIIAVIGPTMDYEARVVELMPKTPAAKAPFDVTQFMSSMTMMGLVMGVAMGAVAMSVWPAILYVWAGRIRRDASTTAESSALGPEVGSSHEDHR